jgi:membrane fusion protein, heavy metal efflux system
MNSRTRDSLSPLLHGTRLSTLCLLGVAVFLVAAPGCKPKSKQSSAVDQVNPNEIAVTPALANNLKMGIPEITDVTGSLQVAAHVETDGRQVAHVGSPVAGRILKLLVFEGQYIRAGTVLAMLHSTDLSDTQFALIKASSQLGLASAAEKRAQQLLAADVIGRAELERRRAEVLQASTEVASYRTQLLGLGMTESQITQLETNRQLSAEYPIVTPKGGTVLKREIAIGQVVQPSDPAFTIADLSSVWIVANVPEVDAGPLRKGMEVTALIPALPDAKITGRLDFVSPIVNPSTRTVEVRMNVANPNGQFKPAELASMTFTGHADSKLTVPNTAVVREGNNDFVFVKTAPQKFVLREVSLGEEENDRRVVLSGVRQDEEIVVDGAFHLNNQRKQNAIKGGA